MCPAALRALAQLTRPTRLKMILPKQQHVSDLHHLSSLQQLQHLDLEGSEGITEQALACLAQLKALTALRLLGWSRVDGTIKGLEQLAALQDLTLLSQPLQSPALAPLAALTALTRLKASEADIGDECSGPALPS